MALFNHSLVISSATGVAAVIDGNADKSSHIIAIIIMIIGVMVGVMALQ
jgi:hypothetical protein